MAGSRQGDGMGTAWERHVGDLPAFSVFSATTQSSKKFIIRSMPISDAGGQCETNNFFMGEEKLIIFVQGHVCLYNLQHKDFNNNLAKDNWW
jgi:hypothetical protein